MNCVPVHPAVLTQLWPWCQSHQAAMLVSPGPLPVPASPGGHVGVACSTPSRLRVHQNATCCKQRSSVYIAFLACCCQLNFFLPASTWNGAFGSVTKGSLNSRGCFLSPKRDAICTRMREQTDRRPIPESPCTGAP